MTQSRRHISGTAHIVFGPGPTSPSSAPSQQTTLHHHHHDHHDHPNEPNQAPHFWAIMPSPSTDSCFVLEGTPHSLGSYPPDIPEPHRCMPPHLYYATTVYEYILDTSTLHTSTWAPKATWTLPYVHRLGDGRDDAGGLTSAYHLLVDREDADDFGAFIGQIMEEDAEDENHNINKAALYACTNILVGETRVLGGIQKHFFEEPWKRQQGTRAGAGAGGAATGGEVLPQSLAQLKRVFDTTAFAQASSDSEDEHSFSLCISDLQLVLPKK
ncbi:hypothetical protein BGZ74_000430 [Mortierella antarctica]|nr:hypothetical protein BGZ74_000430 [Mortierella antarctica]